MRAVFLQVIICNTPQPTGVHNLHLVGKNTNLHLMRIRIWIKASVNQSISNNLTQSNRRYFLSIDKMPIF